MFVRLRPCVLLHGIAAPTCRVPSVSGLFCFEVSTCNVLRRGLSCISMQHFCSRTLSSHSMFYTLTTTDEARIQYRTAPSPFGATRSGRGYCPTVSTSTRCWWTIRRKLPRRRPVPDRAVASVAGPVWVGDVGEDVGEDEDRSWQYGRCLHVPLSLDFLGYFIYSNA